jgi:hypothetical protein
LLQNTRPARSSCHSGFAELTARGLTGWVLNSQPLARRLTDELRLPAFEQRPGPDGGYRAAGEDLGGCGGGGVS